MGQYYKAINVDKMEAVKPEEYGNNGAKIMEHSYIGNEFMDVIENLLSTSGTWYKCRIVWAGDYADHEPNAEQNLYDIADKIISPGYIESEQRYIINHTLKVFVDKTKLKPDSDGLHTHPLPIFTAEGNGRGGGDFRGNDTRIGTWARHIISCDKVIPEGYTEIDGQFVEA